MTHAFLSIAIPFDPDKQAEVETALDTLGNPIDPAVRAIFDEAGIVHFMCSAIVEADAGEWPILVFEISADGSEKDAIALFAPDNGTTGPLLHPILDLLGKGAQSYRDFLEPYIVRTGIGLSEVPGLNFTGTPGMNVQRILAEADLSDRLSRHIEGVTLTGTPLENLKALRAAIASDPAFEGVRTLAEETEPVAMLAPAPPSPNWGLSFYLSLLLPATRALLWPVFIAAIIVAFVRSWPEAGEVWGLGTLWDIVWRFVVYTGIFGLLAWATIFISLSRRETNEEPNDQIPDQARLADVREREDRAGLQNHLFGVSRMKPGILRKFTLRLAFWLIGYGAANLYRPGHLSDIGTIHFARWFRIPNTDKLIFCSNYGGSWESYLEDFITKAPAGLTAVWSNTVGFPKTSFLLFKGARNADPFKRWARRQQYPTRFWYVAYPHLTTDRIRINAALRNGLVSAATEDEARAVMSLFGSRAQPANVIEKEEVQTLLMSGMGRYRQSACVLLTLPDDPAKARGMLRALSGRVGFGERPGRVRVDQIALSAHGLRKLGHQNHLAEFPYVFQAGMEARAIALGDLEEDAPGEWAWGSGKAAVDLAVLVYVQPGTERPPKDAGEKVFEEYRNALRMRMDAAIADVRENADIWGGGEVATIVTLDLDNRQRKPEGAPFAKEFFGFADGISQPRIRGLRPYRLIEDEQHILAPGEFILGYPDNRGQRAFAARVPASDDPDQILPVVGADHGRAHEPDLAKSGINAPRDLGRNGSYLVIRQLGQNKTAFDNFLTESARRLGGHPGLPAGLTEDQLKMYIGAKMVGRWQDGTSLVAYPNEPGTGWDGKDTSKRPDNGFLMGRDDPAGLACPYGSHVRRTNPRDSLRPGSEKQVDITNRHRILRRGRFFEGREAENRDHPEGLLFICANADIERQFEFIQQTWMMAPQFHGSANEVDPLFSGGSKEKRMTIPTEDGPVILTGLQDFVQVVGGEYFFLPSRAALAFLAAD